MGSIISFLVGKTIFGRVISERAARQIATLGLFLLIAGVCATVVSCLERKGATNYVQKAERRAAPATTKASNERAHDAITDAKHEQEMHDVIHSVPDAAPAAPSHALACERLRKRGNPPAACR